MAYTKTTTEFAKDHRDIALSSPCSPTLDGDGATAASVARNATRPFPSASGRRSNVETTHEEKGRLRAYVRTCPHSSPSANRPPDLASLHVSSQTTRDRPRRAARRAARTSSAVSGCSR